MDDPSAAQDLATGGNDDPEATWHLIQQARDGNSEALDRLFARHLPRLRAWARGRLPRWARDIADTQDLVQDTLLQVFKRIDHFEVRGPGALNAYLRQALVNRIRNEVRHGSRRPDHTDLSLEVPANGTSPIEAAIGREALDEYEAGLARLSQADREAIISRIELGLAYDEIARVLEKPSAGAARVAVSRALMKLAVEMQRTPRQA